MADELKMFKETEKVGIELYNKLRVKLFTAPTIDKAFIQSMAILINKEKPSLDLDDVILPLIAYAITKSVDSESQFYQLSNSFGLDIVNSMKNDQYSQMPANMKQAWKMHKIMTYIGDSIRGKLGLNETYQEEKAGENKNFH